MSRLSHEFGADTLFENKVGGKDTSMCGPFSIPGVKPSTTSRPSVRASVPGDALFKKRCLLLD